MSYEIMYRSLFIELSDGTIVPLIEQGSNNCCDWRGKRVRNWSTWPVGCDGKMSYTFDEIRASIDGIVEHIKKEYVNRPVNPYDPNNKDYYTYRDIEKELSRFSCITIVHQAVTSEKSFRGFFERAYRRRVRMADEYVCMEVWAYDGEGNTIREYAKTESELHEVWDLMKKSGLQPHMGIVNADALWKKVSKK